MNHAEIYPQPTHRQSFYERLKKWVISFLQQAGHNNVTPPTANTKERSVFATEQEAPRSATAPTNTETWGSPPRHQPHTQPPYPVAAQPSISSYATQFQGAHNFTISGNPSFTNIGVNNGVNNVTTVNNNAGVHVDNRGQQSYNITVGTQYGNTNIGDGQHNEGNTYNFKGDR